MTRLPVVSGTDVVRVLVKCGFAMVRRESSHIVMRRVNPYSLVVVPDHKSISPGTLRVIINQAGLSKSEFIDLLKK